MTAKKTLRSVVIPMDGEPYETALESDENGSMLKALQREVEGLIAASGYPFPYEIALYVNDEGLYGCTPNRAVFATREMAEAGCLSEIDGSRLGEGDLAAVIFGRAVAVGFDPATGEDVDLTDEQAELVKRTFSESGPSRSCSGVLAVMRIQMGIDVAVAGA